MRPIRVPAATVSPRATVAVEDAGRCARQHFAAIDPDRVRHRRRPVTAHAEFAQPSGDGVLDARDRFLVGGGEIAGFDSQRRLAAQDRGVRQIDRRRGIGRPAAIDRRCGRSRTRAPGGGRIRHLRRAVRNPVDIRPQRLVAVTTVDVDDVRRARDDLPRDGLGNALGERAVGLARETRDSGSCRRPASNKSSGRETTACSRRAP